LEASGLVVIVGDGVGRGTGLTEASYRETGGPTEGVGGASEDVGGGDLQIDDGLGG